MGWVARRPAYAALGSVRLVDAVYDDPEGREIVLDADMRGQKRSGKRSPGPIEGLKAGKNVVWTTVWRTRVSPLLKPLQYNCRVINNVTKDVASLMPHSAVADWYYYASRNPGWLYDGIHVTSGGLAYRYRQMDAAARSLLATNPAPA